MSNYLPEGVNDEMCSSNPSEKEEFDEFDDGLDDEEEDYSDCGWMPQGGCSMAGSEECDFECPNRESMIAELDRKAKRKPEAASGVRDRGEK